MPPAAVYGVRGHALSPALASAQPGFATGLPTAWKDMCISCGNCSTYCEMGIDVRAYAMANQTFTRASCVGCGLPPTSVPARRAQARGQARPVQGRDADTGLRG